MKTTDSRRSFLGQASAVLAVPWIVSPSSLGLGRFVPPSDRIVMAAIGCGGKGRHNTKMFLEDSRVQVVAVCDVDRNHLEQAVAEVNQHYGNADCLATGDFRDLTDRPDVDAVHVSTPDHWHAVASVAAMRRCKDVYCEKPLANSFGESKAIRDAARQTGRILQCGSHERSTNNCRLAAELVRNGRIGQLQSVLIQMPCTDPHHLEAMLRKTPDNLPPVPGHLDWDRWQGHTGPVPYHSERCHFWWRFVLDYGGGEMTDRGAHIIDIAQLAMDADQTGPVLFEARGEQVPGSPYDAFWNYSFVNTYANGVRMTGSATGPRGVRFEGTEGWLFVAIHGGALTASSPELLPEYARDGRAAGSDEPLPDDFRVRLGRSPGHHRNFIDCVISRDAPMATAEMGHRTATICHMNNIAMRTGRTLRWDPVRESLINDPAAGQWLVPDMRPPWSV